MLPTAAPVKQVEASRGAGLQLLAPWNQRSTACIRLGLVASPQFPDSSRCLGRSRPVVTWQRHHSIVHHRALCGCQQLANTSPSLCPPIIHAIINLLYRATLPAQLGFRWNYGKKLRLCIHLPNERGSPTGSVSYFDCLIFERFHSWPQGLWSLLKWSDKAEKFARRRLTSGDVQTTL